MADNLEVGDIVTVPTTWRSLDFEVLALDDEWAWCKPIDGSRDGLAGDRYSLKRHTLKLKPAFVPGYFRLVPHHPTGIHMPVWWFECPLADPPHGKYVRVEVTDV